MAAELNVFSVHPVRRWPRRQEVVTDSVSVLDEHSCRIQWKTGTTGRTPRDCSTISVGRILAKDSIIDKSKQRNCYQVLIGPTKDLEKSNCNKSYNKDVDEADESKASKPEDPKTCNSGQVSLKDSKDSNNNVSGEESVSKRISYVLLLGKF